MAVEKRLGASGPTGVLSSAPLSVILCWSASVAGRLIINGMLREAVSPQTAAVAIAVIGLNIHFGFTGLLNMGQAGFMLLGCLRVRDLDRQGDPVAGRHADRVRARRCVFALVLGIPTLKLRGDYLAIVTISAAEIIRYIGRLGDAGGLHRCGPGHPGSQYREPVHGLSFFSGGGTVRPDSTSWAVSGIGWR